ncbi:hypothetical protein G3545_18940 [Starkeya sp. ORNL1]|uniref:hypothetical protein n=1 Tax=Starkeya sp. ORNL1 TaxID=2709380 RepID=UPI00146457CD|nr:hypothetical protein [Starkeya sp. ORNL1]QJP15548.1 hypothetical protein G3545_18940 [Starkeya sp. ORNL1]
MPDAPAMADGHLSESHLARTLGLDAGETAVLGKLFGAATAALGIEGGPIFERLSKGETLGGALALPAGTDEVLYARAHRWFAAGRPERAEPLFQALCLLDGTSADYWIGYGVCLKLRGAFTEAAMAFEIAGRLRPDWAMPDFHTLEIALRTGDFTAAAEHLKNFDAHAGAGDIPDAVRAEVSRWRVALEMRARRAGSSA